MSDEDKFNYKDWNVEKLLEKKSTPHYWTFQLLECNENPNCHECYMKEFMAQRGLKCQCKKIIALLIKLGKKPSPTMQREWENKKAYINIDK